MASLYYLVIFVLAALFIYSSELHLPWSNEVSGYAVSCLEWPKKNGTRLPQKGFNSPQEMKHCLGTSSPSNIFSTSFNIHTSRNEVTFVSSGEVLGLTNCTIHDQSNWVCESNNRVWKFKDGIGGEIRVDRITISRRMYLFEKALHLLHLKNDK